MSIIQDIPELRKLIIENPELPICVLVENDLPWEEYSYTYAASVRVYIGEILDCDVPYSDGYVFNDRDDLGEHLQCHLDVDDSVSDEEFEKLVDKEVEKYEPYWKKVIVVRAESQ